MCTVTLRLTNLTDDWESVEENERYLAGEWFSAEALAEILSELPAGAADLEERELVFLEMRAYKSTGANRVKVEQLPPALFLGESDFDSASEDINPVILFDGRPAAFLYSPFREWLIARFAERPVLYLGFRWWREMLEDERPTYACDNCSWEGEKLGRELSETPGLQERLDPGGVVPAGECPKCAAFAYIQKKT